jgi:hypothetical protein
MAKRETIHDAMAPREPEDSMSIESVNKKYAEAKLAEIGYPGLGPTTSQADVMKEKADEPTMYGVANGGCVQSMYPPHEFKPSQTGLIGAPCAVCGGLPTESVHIKEPEPLLEGQIRVQAIDDKVAGCIRIEIDNAPNEQAERVLTKIVPSLLELYLKKSKDYGGDVGEMIGLGPKAHFVDMWRKMGKLKRALWDGVELEGEKPEEIMMDLVGHIFIILDKMARG